MNITKTVLLTALLASPAFAQLVTGQHESENTQPPTSKGSSATMSTGTILQKDLRWDSKIPLNKTYGEFTPEQKAELHAMYETLPPGDEPPFPEKGMKPIFNRIKNAQHILQARGELNMRVTVGPDGKPTKVEDYSQLYSPKMSELAQRVLLETQFKPAICSGKPCEMQFRFYQKLGS